jgi:hypothetical protein
MRNADDVAGHDAVPGWQYQLERPIRGSDRATTSSLRAGPCRSPPTGAGGYFTLAERVARTSHDVTEKWWPCRRLQQSPPNLPQRR